MVSPTAIDGAIERILVDEGIDLRPLPVGQVVAGVQVRTR